MLWYNILFVFAFGSIFGLAELINRHSNIKLIFTLFLGWLYIGINGIVSIIAFLLIKYFKGPIASTEIEITYIIVAGFGAMMILRSSIYSIKIKDKQVDIGLGQILQTFLNAIEKSFGTNSGELQMTEIEEIMRNVDFVKAKDSLTMLCVSYRDNFSQEDSESLNQSIESIANTSIPNKVKAMQLGKSISKFLSTKLLKKAVNILGNDIRITPGISSDTQEDINNFLNSIQKSLRQ